MDENCRQQNSNCPKAAPTIIPDSSPFNRLEDVEWVSGWPKEGARDDVSGLLLVTRVVSADGGAGDKMVEGVVRFADNTLVEGFVSSPGEESEVMLVGIEVSVLDIVEGGVYKKG